MMNYGLDIVNKNMLSGCILCKPDYYFWEGSCLSSCNEIPDVFSHDATRTCQSTNYFSFSHEQLLYYILL